MGKQKASKSTVKAPEKHGNVTPTEKFLRECVLRNELYKSRKAHAPKEVITKTPARSEEVSKLSTLAKRIDKRKLREIFRQANPWLFQPDAIHKHVFKLIRKEHSFAFAKQLTRVLDLSFKISDLQMQLTAMNPGLLKAQRDGTIEQEVWETIHELTEAWKKLIQIT